MVEDKLENHPAYKAFLEYKASLNSDIQDKIEIAHNPRFLWATFSAGWNACVDHTQHVIRTSKEIEGFLRGKETE